MGVGLRPSTGRESHEPEDLPVEVVQTMADRDEQQRPALAAVIAETAPAQQEQPRPAEAPRRHLRLVR